MHSSQRPLSIIVLTMAALSGSGCGEAANQPAPKSAEQWREEWKQNAAKQDAQQKEFKQSIAQQQEEIRKNDERITALRAENEALRKQLESTQPTAPAPAKP